MGKARWCAVGMSRAASVPSCQLWKLPASKPQDGGRLCSALQARENAGRSSSRRSEGYCVVGVSDHRRNGGAQRARGEPILFNSVKWPTQLWWCPHLSSAVVEQQRLVETSSKEILVFHCGGRLLREFVECTHIEWAQPFLGEQMFRSRGTSNKRVTRGPLLKWDTRGKFSRGMWFFLTDLKTP